MFGSPDTRSEALPALRRGSLERMLFIQRNVIAPMQRRRRRRAAVADLEGLTDQLLSDIGISRDEIPRVVEGLVSGDARAASPQAPVAPGEEPRDHLRRAA